MKKVFFVLSLIFISLFANADDFYWVGDGGNWSDFDNHWATTSGGAVMRTSLPDADDNVFFDANSFSTADQVVSIDTSFAACKAMNWENVTNLPEFSNAASDTLLVSEQLILATTDNMRFSIFGRIVFAQSIPAQTLTFDPKDQLINGDIDINISSTSVLNLVEDLNMKQGMLNVFDGELNLANHDLFLKHFNSDTTLIIPIIINSPSLSNVDTLICYGSLHFTDALDISLFNGLLVFESHTIDTNYVDFENHLLNSKIVFLNSKEFYLQSEINTSKNLDFQFSGKFFSQNNDIYCDSLLTEGYLTRTIDLGTSEIFTSVFSIEQTGLTIISANANLNFVGIGDYTFNNNKTDLTFTNVSFTLAQIIHWRGYVTADKIELVAGNKLYLQNGAELDFNTFVANGDCGDYIEIRAVCDDCSTGDCGCVATLPQLISGNPITNTYLKLSNVEAVGNFTANDSFDEGGVVNWTISEPAVSSSLYWIGNTGVWNDNDNWAIVSGGPAGACVPSKNTHVVFDALSFAGNDTVYVDDYCYCASMTWKNLVGVNVMNGEGDLFVTDSIVLFASMVADFSGTMFLQNETASNITITTNGVDLNCFVDISGLATWDFDSPFTIYNTVNLDRGNILFSGNFFEAYNFTSTTTEIRTINLANTLVFLIGNNIVWDIDPTNLTLSSAASVVSINSGSSATKTFNGGSLIYDDIVLNSDIININGSNTFDIFKVSPGKNIYFESSSTTNVDSIVANGDCQNQIFLGSNLFDFPANLHKTGFDTLQVAGLCLRNLIADTVGGIYYEANQSFGQGNTDGWTFIGSPINKTFYWLGVNTDWNDLSNWEVNSLPAVCLPTLNDTVIVTATNFATALTDTISIGSNAFCHQFISTEIIGQELIVVFEQNLYIASALELSDSTRFEYTVHPELVDIEDIDFGLVICPDSINFNLNPQDAKLNVCTYINPTYDTDTINLNSDIIMDTVASLNIKGGTFLASGRYMQLGSLVASTDAAKIVDISNCDIDVFVHVDLQDNTILQLDADSSKFSLNGNSIDFSYFRGGAQDFYDVAITGNSIEDENDLVIFLSGSNTYHILEVYDGVDLFVESTTTHTVDSLLKITGTCQFPMTFQASTAASACNFVLAYADTVTGASIKDVNVNAAIAMLSEDDGGNSGWTFDATQAVVANYTIPYPACVETSLEFLNTSVSMWGGDLHLTYEWELIDSITNVDTLYYTFDLPGDYIIQLTSTDTITGCLDVFIDTLTLEDHSIHLTCSDTDLEICAGDTVTFDAVCDASIEVTFYLNNTPLALGGTHIHTYTTDTLHNTDELYIEAVNLGCMRYSDTISMIVNPNPIVGLICSDADDTICDGDSISFQASGADLYEFYIDDVSTGPISATSVFTSFTLTDASVVSVQGWNANDCSAYSLSVYTITVLPNPVVTLTSTVMPPTICDGDTLRLDATGAVMYEFFINGIVAVPFSAQDFIETDTLSNGDIILVQGYNANGCNSFSNLIEIEVNVSPVPMLTSSEDDAIICTGENITFFASGATEYQFFIDGTSQGAYSSSNSLSSTTLTHHQLITLIGRIGVCERYADTTIDISVFPVIDLIASTTEICIGENIDFTASGDTIYQFFVDGVSATALSPTATFSTTGLTNGQVVSVEGTPGACLPSGQTITVHPEPIVLLSCSEIDEAICIGDELSFDASGAYQYEFFVDAVSQGPPSLLANFTSSIITNGQVVSVIGYTEYSCFASSSDVYTITVYDYPVVSLTAVNPSTTICAGDEQVFNVSGADEYQFYISDISQGAWSATSTFATSTITNNETVSVSGETNGCIANAPETFTYTVIDITNIHLVPISPISVCELDNIQVQASGAVEYEFFVNSISQGAPSVNSIFESTLFSDEDEITVVGTQGICSEDGLDTITVDVNVVPDLTFTSDIIGGEICFGDTIEFITTGAMTFQYYIDTFTYGPESADGTIQIPNLEQGQTVYVIGYNNACFNNADNSFSPTVNYINLEIISSNNIICNGDEVIAYVSGADLYEYFIDGVSVGAASNVDSIILSNLVDGQILEVVGTNSTTSCTYQSEEIYYTVNENPVITVSPSSEFCEYDSIYLHSNFDANNQWLLNSSEIVGAIENSFVTYLGGAYSVFYSNGIDGGVFSCGVNSLGQLGNGNNVQSEFAQQALLENSFVAVNAGKDFVIAIDNDKNVWAWGDNAWGNLGNGDYSPIYTPIQIESISDIDAVSAGHYHVLAIKDDGTLLSWGRNTSGQLGYGNNASSNFPMPIAGLTDIVEIATGSAHSLALTSDGHIYSWGSNEFGQLGIGSLDDELSPILIAGIDNVASISVGANHSIAIKTDGSMWTWGCNDNGQLGLNSINSSLLPVENPYIANISYADGGVNHTLAVNTRGDLFSWGGNAEGQLGNANNATQLYPAELIMQGVAEMTCGLFGSYVIKTDASLWAWGFNSFGQLGDETLSNKNTPTQANQFHGIADISAGQDFMAVIWDNATTCTSQNTDITMYEIPEITITQDGMTLTTIEGLSYQWYFNDSPLGSTNSQSITITAQGNYSVEVFFEHDCSDFSEPFPFFLDIDDYFVENNIQISPNPNNGNFNLIINMPIDALKKITSYKLVSITGSTIYSNTSFDASQNQEIKFESLAPGMYYFVLSSDTQNITSKFCVTQ